MPAPFGNTNASGSRSPEQRARMSAAALARAPETREAQRRALMGNRFVKDAPVIGECVYCGAPARTRDHVIPRGRPGWDEPDNFVPACLPCNASKHQREPAEWLADGLRAS